ncbi:MULTISPECIES: sucrase ferredoxin [Nocardioides]|uniref:Sucrase ferredoxin n=1 Tax=Nocardioides vastitatis TaxID=2568655 RepID=A0ABW0ZQJ2_9ACTN|nr:sucrase ferredoxin [Nocardioides sp.]THJ06483.1 sucrase ferredoxin [Nocardioides sp.]
MSTDQGRFSCAAASLSRDEPIAGTATHVRTWLLLEHSGPWGDVALRDARLPEGAGASLRQLATAHRAKILLVRRARASRDPQRLNVFAASADPIEPRLEHGTVADLREVLDLDLTAFRAGGTTGLDAHPGPVFAVCTNGRHDACCAELGRPVALALDDEYPDHTWEVSHIGGDRFAGNMVVLPHGLYYGRLTPARAAAVAAGHLEGELDLDSLRGRSSYPMAVQAAELELRRTLGATAITAVRLTGREVDGDVTAATFASPAGSIRVTVRTIVDPATATRLTCKAHRANPVPRHEIVGIEQA